MKIRSLVSSLWTKYKSIAAPVKAALWFTLCNIIQKGISMITVPIFTRLLTAEQYGVFSVYQSWYSVISVFATLNLYYGVFNNGMVKYPDRKDAFTSSVQGLTTTITAALFVMFLVAQDFWCGILELPAILVYVMFIELLFAPAYSFWAARQRFEYKYVGLVIVTLLMAVGSPVLGIAAVLISAHKAEARIISFVLVQVVIGLVCYIYNLKKGKKFFSKEFWKFALAFNIPLIPHYLSQSILQQVDRIMISRMVGTDKAAIYSVAYSISTLMVLITSAINNSFIPYTYNCIKERRFADLRKHTNSLIMLVGVGTFFVVVFGPEIIRLFAPAEYYEAIWIIPPVSASVYFMFLYPVFGNVEFYFEENRFVAMASIVGAVANVVLNYFCIQWFGYIAAGYTTLVCYILFSLGHYVFMNKVLKKHMPGEKPYNIPFIVMFSGVVLAAMGIITFSYTNFIFRYALIVAMLILLWVKRNWVLRTVLSIKK